MVVTYVLQEGSHDTINRNHRLGGSQLTDTVNTVGQSDKFVRFS